MDLILLVGVAVALLVVIITLFFLKNKDQSKPANAEPQRGPEGGRRAQVARNQRNRVVRAARQENQDDDDDSELPTNIPEFDETMGTKKRAKLEAKAEKKKHREAEVKMREDQKQKDELAEVERKKIEEKENEAERLIEEAAKKAQAEKERQEYEEYLKLKQEFSVQEEGFDEEEDDTESLLQNFIDYIKTNKVVILEDLAAQFKLKTQAAIDRIVELQKDGRLSGVIDDRGKFIFISEEELKAVAKFIKQRGRVSIAELAENSNQLINLAG